MSSLRDDHEPLGDPLEQALSGADAVAIASIWR
jgi:hypothetical protein